jgi:hypothetical protein
METSTSEFVAYDLYWMQGRETELEIKEWDIAGVTPEKKWKHSRTVCKMRKDQSLGES